MPCAIAQMPRADRCPREAGRRARASRPRRRDARAGRRAGPPRSRAAAPRLALRGPPSPSPHVTERSVRAVARIPPDRIAPERLEEHAALADVAQRAEHLVVCAVPVDLDVELVAPGLTHDRAGVQRRHVHAVVAERLDRRVQRAGLVARDHAQRRAPGARLVAVETQVAGQRREPRQVLGVIGDLGQQHHEPVLCGRQRTRDRSHGRVAELRDVPGGVRGRRRSDARVAGQAGPALRERHRMAVHGADAFEGRAGDADETVGNVQDRLGDDRELAPLDDRERVGDETGERVLDRQHRAIDLAARGRARDLLEVAERDAFGVGIQAGCRLLRVRPGTPGIGDAHSVLSPLENDEGPLSGASVVLVPVWRDRPSASRDPGEADKGEGSREGHQRSPAYHWPT